METVVVVQLVERSVPTPGITSLIPVIDKFDLLLTLFKNCIENTKIRKRDREIPS